MNCKNCYWGGNCDFQNIELADTDCCYQDEYSCRCYDSICHYYYPIGLDEQLDYEEELYNNFMAKDENEQENIGMSVFRSVNDLAETESRERLQTYYGGDSFCKRQNHMSCAR